MKLKPLHYLFLFFPIASVFICSAFSRIGKEAGEKVFFRPPSWFFSFIWVVLLLLFGWSLVESTLDTYNKGIIICYAIVNALLIAWIFTYNHNKKWAIWILAVTFMMGLYCYTLINQTSKLYLIPLITWVLFALFMATNEITQLNKV